MENALVPLMQLHDRMLLLAGFAEAKLDAILEKADTCFVCEWAETFLAWCTATRADMDGSRRSCPA